MKDKEFVVEKIRSQYTEAGHTDLDALKALDAKARRPANRFGYIYGSKKKTRCLRSGRG